MTILAGEKILAADHQNAALSVRKASDTTRASTTTLAADPELLIPVEANTIYYVNAIIWVICSTATPDIRNDWTTPTGASGYWTAERWQVGTAGTSLVTTQTFSQPWNGGTVVGWANNAAPAVPDLHKFEGFLVTSGTAGSLTFRWAQNTSSTDTTTVKAGSILSARKVG